MPVPVDNSNAPTQYYNSSPTAKTPIRGNPAPAPKAAPAPAPAPTPSYSADPYGLGSMPLPGASYTPAPSSAPLATDPTYLAFMRALGAEEADLKSASDLGVSNLQRELARRIPDVLLAGEDARRNISGGFEARGLYASGEHEKALGRQRQAESSGIANLQGTEADQESALQLQLAQRLAAIQQQRSENTLTAAGQSYLGQ